MRHLTRPAVSVLLAVFGLLGATLHAEDTASPTYDGPKEALHIYLLIGQSNMAGRAPFTPAESGAIDGVFLFNREDKWEPAKNPLNRHSTIRKGLGMQKMNPGYSFSQTMRKETQGISIGLVVNAKGGTKIEAWQKGSQFYTEAVRRTQAAQNTGTIKGILWHQGESNNTNPEEYLDQLKALVVDLRSDLGVEDLPFVAGQVNNVPAINDQIAQLPQTLHSTAFVSSEGLNAMDRWHFDTASMQLLGKRYAEEMLRIQEQARENNRTKTRHH